jgi:ribose-phosphate pyrophosphokinase
MELFFWVTSLIDLFVVLVLQPVILDYLASKMISAEDLVVVSPDVGGVARARAFAKKLSDAPLAIVDKRRQGHNVSEVTVLMT